MFVRLAYIGVKLKLSLTKSDEICAFWIELVIILSDTTKNKKIWLKN